MPPLPKKVSLRASPKGKNKPAGKKNKNNFFYLLFFLLIAAGTYYKFFGIPDFLLKIISQKEEIVYAPRISRETEVALPRLIAKGFSVKEPAIPVNASVEEAVKTLRPDIRIEDKNKTPIYNKERRQPFDIHPCPKQAFYLMLNTFYEATPDGVGYLDLVYRAPYFYFVRVIAVDTATRISYINSLKSKGVDLNVIDSATYRNGNVEFSLQGNIGLSEERKSEFAQASKINSEILALRSLAAFNRVRLAGLENPIEENFGLYRRVVLKTTTNADYSSILSFADALQKSDISFGVQQFVSRPLGTDRMQSALEFVMYAAVNR